jgi:RNA polymerase primary sigma factor
MYAKPENEASKNNGSDVSPVARLVQMGRSKSFVTFDDILSVFPYPEQDLEQLDRILEALSRVRIPIIEDADMASDS